MRINGNTPVNFSQTPAHSGPTPQDKQNLQNLLGAVAMEHGNGCSPTTQIRQLNLLDQTLVDLKGEGKINNDQFNQMNDKVFAMIGALQASPTDETTFGKSIQALGEMISDL